jgi:hypothetical protein
MSLAQPRWMGLTVSGAQNSKVAYFDDTSEAGYRQLQFTSSNNGQFWDINSQGTSGGLGGVLTLSTRSIDRMEINTGGDISFFEDTGTTARFRWSSANETISIGSGASSTATISAYSRTVSASLPSALRIIENTSASSYWDIGSDGGASPNLKFYVNANTTPKVTFTSSGNVGIGTSSPQAPLHARNGSSGVSSFISGTRAIIEGTATTYLTIAAPNTSVSGILFADPDDSDNGFIKYDHSASGVMSFGSAGTERMPA